MRQFWDAVRARTNQIESSRRVEAINNACHRRSQVIKRDHTNTLRIITTCRGGGKKAMGEGNCYVYWWALTWFSSSLLFVQTRETIVFVLKRIKEIRVFQSKRDFVMITVMTSLLIQYCNYMSERSFCLAQPTKLLKIWSYVNGNFDVFQIKWKNNWKNLSKI